jgi:hypothetical protein
VVAAPAAVILANGRRRAPCSGVLSARRVRPQVEDFMDLVAGTAAPGVARELSVCIARGRSEGSPWLLSTVSLDLRSQ